MSETRPENDTERTEAPEPSPGEGGEKRSRGFLRSMFDQARQVGRDALAVTFGRLLEEPDEPQPHVPAELEPQAKRLNRRVNMLHSVAEQLRGAADDYVAAKLDELEARVDQKLDEIEVRIDRKIVEFHRQLVEMRDRELRHRLRLLKITLIFTGIVAIISLAYKWFEIHWLR